MKETRGNAAAFKTHGTCMNEDSTVRAPKMIQLSWVAVFSKKYNKSVRGILRERLPKPLSRNQLISVSKEIDESCVFSLKKKKHNMES